MGARRIRRELRQIDMAESRLINGVRKVDERKRRDERAGPVERSESTLGLNSTISERESLSARSCRTSMDARSIACMIDRARELRNVKRR